MKHTNLEFICKLTMKVVFKKRKDLYEITILQIFFTVLIFIKPTFRAISSVHFCLPPYPLTFPITSQTH